MVEYEGVCYLDMQKTGSTFVERFLADHMRGAPLRSEKHGRIHGGYDPAKFHFITCRRPIDLYLSLFFSGCDGRGALRRRLGKAGLDALYGERSAACFARWLAFMLDADHAAELAEDYAGGAPSLYGFQTHRFLSLALNKAEKKLADVSTPQELRFIFRRRTIVDAIVRTERLNDGLRELARTELGPYLGDVGEALAVLDGAERLNVSRREDEATPFETPLYLERLVEERDWFLYELMSYPRAGDETSASGVPAAVMRIDRPAGRKPRA